MTAYGLTVGMIGPTAAAVKRDLLKRGRSAEWNRLVRNAHKQGYAIDSFLDPNIPQPLKQRTTPFLRKQATDMVGTAYAPAFKDLSDREKRVAALDAKRAADNAFYNTWLNSQHQALMTAAQASDQALESTVKTVQASTGAAYDQARRGAVAELSTPGSVSDFSGAKALGQVDAAKATAVGQVGATGQQALAGIGTAQGMRELAGANNFATIAALEAKRVGDTWSANQDLSSERYKLSTSQAQDVSKAILDSTDLETKKAQSNRDFAAVMQKLDLTQQNNLSLAANRRSNARHSAATLKESIRYHNQLTSAKKEAAATGDANSEANFAAKWGVSRDTFLSWSDAQRQQYLQRARDRGIISGGKNSKDSFTPTQLRGSQRDYRAALNWAKGHKPSPGELNNLVTALQAPKSAGETVHDPATGKVVYNSDGTPKRQGGGGFGISDPLLAKAVALVAIYGGVDAKTRKAVKEQYGITLPASKKVSFKPKANAPTLIDKTK